MAYKYFREIATNELYVKEDFEVNASGGMDSTRFEEIRAPNTRERYDPETGGWVAEEYDQNGNPYT